jgi:hypothetical protein
MALLVAWLLGGLLPLLLYHALEPLLPDGEVGLVCTVAVAVGFLCTLAALPLLLVGAVVLHGAFGYW